MNFWIKLIGFSALLWTGSTYLDSVDYNGWLPILVTSVALTITGVIADKLLVPRLGNLLSTILGLFGITLIIWVVARLIPNNLVLVTGAFIMSLPAGIMEWILHRYVSPGIRY